MVQSVQCINRYAMADAPPPQSGGKKAKPSFGADYYECSYIPEEKHGSFLGFLAKTALVLGVIAGGLVAARKYIKPLKEVNIEEKKVTGFLNNVKHYTAKAADFVERNAKSAYEWCATKIKSLKSDAPKEETKAEEK